MYTKRNVNVKKKKPWSHRKIHIHTSTDLNRSTCEEARLRVCVLCPESSKNGTLDLNFFQLYLKTLNHYYLQIQNREYNQVYGMHGLTSDFKQVVIVSN